MSQNWAFCRRCSAHQAQLLHRAESAARRPRDRITLSDRRWSVLRAQVTAVRRGQMLADELDHVEPEPRVMRLSGTHLTPREMFTRLLMSFTPHKLLDETADSFAGLNEALKRRAEAR